VEAQKFGDLRAVGRIFVDAQLQALSELLIELLVVVFLLCNFGKHFKALLHQILLDHAKDFVLLQSFAGDVQWQVLRIHDALHHVQPLWHKLVAIVHNEDTADVKLNVVALLFGLEEIERSTAWYEQQSPELKLAFHTEMLNCKMVLPIVRERLVKGRVFLVGDIF